jgi:UPF0716 protein FxsA
MTRGKLILLAILALPFAEIAAFWLVADAIGFLAAFLMLLAGSLAGVLILSWLGRRLLEKVIGNLQDQRIHIAEVQPDTVFTVIGALLLALPGFVTGAIGVLLLLPPVQRRLSANVAAGRTARRDGIVDLEDNEWTRVPEARLRNGDRPTSS